MSLDSQYVVLILLLFQHGVDALTIFSTRAEPGTENACPTKRSLFKIVWNCVFTTIICAWVSVHPNVPPSGYWKGLWRRVKMMIWTIIAPELILAWAVRQWFAAWEIRDLVNGLEGGWLTGLKQTMQGLFGRSPVSNKWTMAHGLVVIGGISTVDPSFSNDGQVDPHSPVLTFERYTKIGDRKSQTSDEDIKTEERKRLDRKLRKISEEDIKDRSKGDILSKLIAITQTTWFILQCIARSHQKLTLTELELVTLALASLNAITYAFWWHKPLGIQMSIRIYFETEAVERVDAEDADAGRGITAFYILSKFGSLVAYILTKSLPREFRNFSSENPFLATLLIFLIISPVTLVILVLFFLPLPFALGIVFLLNILKTKPVEQEFDDPKVIAAQIVLALRKLRYKFTSFIARSLEKWLKKFLDSASRSEFYIGWLLVIPTLFAFLLVTTILLFPFFVLLYLVSFIFTAVFGIITSSTVAPNSLHVHAPSTKSDRYSRMVVYAFSGVIFGGLHCIGWNFTYPTAFEQHLWRASSLVITAIPLIVAPIDYLLENYKLDNGFLKVLRLILDLTMTILLFIYVPARLTLIGQAFALLRKQPQDAFLAVDWNHYIPHLYYTHHSFWP